ncbi:hypothetical protein THAOC_17638, partial [Thalassiosira oceanica]
SCPVDLEAVRHEARPGERLLHPPRGLVRTYPPRVPRQRVRVRRPPRRDQTESPPVFVAGHVPPRPRTRPADVDLRDVPVDGRGHRLDLRARRHGEQADPLDLAGPVPRGDAAGDGRVVEVGRRRRPGRSPFPANGRGRD